MEFGPPRGYVRSLLAVSQNLNSAAEVDAAYQKFVSANNEAAVLDAAKKLAAEKPHTIHRERIIRCACAACARAGSVTSTGHCTIQYPADASARGLGRPRYCDAAEIQRDVRAGPKGSERSGAARNAAQEAGWRI